MSGQRPMSATAPATNPFTDAVPWPVTRPPISYQAVDQAITHAGLCQDDPAVYQAITAYAFDEAECHPSQQQVADDLGRTRESVNRAVQRLARAGWLRIKEKRWTPGFRWCHNVYELLAAFVVGAQTIKRIVRRAHRRVSTRFGLSRAKGHTNRGHRCRCWWCKVDRASIRRPPPALPGPSSASDRLRRIRSDEKWFAARGARR